jgi:hypothetical protein
MAAGCKNSQAINYNPTANPDNYSCIYLLKNQGNCHWFEDYVPVPDSDQSFTLSHSMKSGWVFFHDYFPDMYVHTRTNLFVAKDSSFYKTNDGPAGRYFQTSLQPAKSFFIDVVFQADMDLLLETINWTTDFLQSQTDQPFKTLTHITVWNSNQHSGRIALSTLQEFKDYTARNTKGQWVLNDFRNILKEKGEQFLQSLFLDYAVIIGQTSPDMAWYHKELLQDKWFCIRFEFDNSVDAKVILHDVTIEASKANR